ncbi:MAG TPA: LPS export ABC transporter permease LptG [Thermohalobaculum sp.]|nr:LPS export ABC transporter permease LptG [Thermohalobaculum sp.]
MSVTLGFYIARRFLAITCSAFVAVFLLIATVDLVELMRSSGTGRAGFADLVGMALLHAPSITITAAPFTVLLSSMACFAMFARSSELVVTRAAGVSVWRLLFPALLAAILLGVFVVTVYNPLAAAFASRFEALESRYFERSSSRLSVSADGLWLRQGGPGGQTVIRAQRASSTIDRLWTVNVFQFDPDDRFYRRIDARSARLDNQAWHLTGVRRWDLLAFEIDNAGSSSIATRPELIDEMQISTDLTSESIQESFAPPETISFWKLPRFIRILEGSGFSSNRHRLHWQGLLAMPAVFVAMVLIGAAFSMRHLRFGGLGYMALGCVLSGFGYFFLSDIAAALGASGAVPVPIAAWAPPLSAVLFALGLLLHLEDG